MIITLNFLKQPDFSRILVKMLRIPDFFLIFQSAIKVPNFSRSSRLHSNPTKRKCFSVAKKAEIIEKSRVFIGTKVDLAKLLGIAYSTLQIILKNERSL